MELDDAFASIELYLYEGLGVCPIGEGGRLVNEGATALGSRIPVNPMLTKRRGSGISSLFIKRAFEWC